MSTWSREVSRVVSIENISLLNLNFMFELETKRLPMLDRKRVDCLDHKLSTKAANKAPNWPNTYHGPYRQSILPVLDRVYKPYQFPLLATIRN